MDNSIFRLKITTERVRGNSALNSNKNNQNKQNMIMCENIEAKWNCCNFLSICVKCELILIAWIKCYFN